MVNTSGFGFIGFWYLGEGDANPTIADSSSYDNTGTMHNMHSSNIQKDETLKKGITTTSSLAFTGTNYIPTLTMLAHAKKGELNHSNNPTYLTYEQDGVNIVDNDGGTTYAERTDLEIANTTKSPHEGAEATFQKQTWISKIGIYDEHNNLIAIAKLANPVRKTEDRDFTFKLKLDF